MTVIIRSQRVYPRIKLNWPIEYRVQIEQDQWIHEGTKLEDYSLSGACFLAMSDLRVGMQILVSIKPPEGKERIELKGEVIRVDSSIDVGRMFKAIGVRWALEVFNQLLAEVPPPLRNLYPFISY